MSNDISRGFLFVSFTVIGQGISILTGSVQVVTILVESLATFSNPTK